MQGRFFGTGSLFGLTLAVGLHFAACGRNKKPQVIPKLTAEQSLERFREGLSDKSLARSTKELWYLDMPASNREEDVEASRFCDELAHRRARGLINATHETYFEAYSEPMGPALECRSEPLYCEVLIDPEQKTRFFGRRDRYGKPSLWVVANMAVPSSGEATIKQEEHFEGLLRAAKRKACHAENTSKQAKKEGKAASQTEAAKPDVKFGETGAQK